MKDESLKTLKDFESIINHGSLKIRSGVVPLVALRGEALKWIKNLLVNREGWLNGTSVDDFTDKWDYNEDSIIEWIKHFFNLTEKDLK